jgi:chromosome partitioning protein
MSNQTRTLETILDIAARLGAVVHQNRQHALTDATQSGKYARRYNQAEAIQATGAHAKNIRGLCEKLGITYQDGNSWRITINDVMALRGLLNPRPFKRSASQQLQIITISSLKGGASKTTTAATLGAGLVSECMNAYRVGMIDLDPQATLTTLLHPRADDSYLTAGDLMTGDIELDEGESFEDACKQAFCDTNIPNLRILPAKDYDREYEVLAEKRKMQGGYVAYKDLQRIIDAVRDDFDIIIIDTAPQFSTATLAAHYVANNVIVPIRPSENDRDASHKYLAYLASMYQLLIGLGHQG